MPAGQGDLLRRKIALAARLMNAVADRFWNHEALAVLFPRFLLTIHGSVRATVPLMTTAIAELRKRPGNDPLRAPLITYFEQHAREEAEHEDWLLRDLQAVGIARDTVADHIASPAIASLVGAQYYWIRFAHPVSLLGLFAVLEGHPPETAHLDEIAQRTGLPPEAFRMLRDHAELDQTHADELFQLIDTLPLTPSQTSLLGISAFHTLDALAAVFKELLPADTVVNPPVFR
jgi:heme oxygenase-like protein